MADSWIVIGAVTSVNPAKRSLRVDAAPRHAHQFEGVSQVRLRTREGDVKTVRVTEVRDTGQGILVTLAAGITRDSVAGLRNAEAIIAPDEVKPRPAGVYVREDFPGMAVVDAEGKAIGIVTDVLSTPAQFVLEIETTDGARMLAPVVDELVRAIDLDARRLVVNDISAFAVRGDADDED